jgi:hypothetical protein
MRQNAYVYLMQHETYRSVYLFGPANDAAARNGVCGIPVALASEAEYNSVGVSLRSVGSVAGAERVGVGQHG